MSDRQEAARYVRELAGSPLATQAATLLRLVSMPNIAEEEIKLLAQLLVESLTGNNAIESLIGNNAIESLTGNNAIEMLISALAPMWDNPQVEELVKQMIVAMPEDRAERLFQAMDARMPFGLRVLRARNRR
ncbi:hypothetical protein [Ktedonospora formicarum]|uniref:Uncharacterized protein n=1 Tax=Ktedonospora formicarum TaxID=2778364 RepID=A0A8J3MWG1_9CHLR|nr:hypothetical protein [Ktedonospora formicarum]GHO48613.1 hypothetical protein KSX_67760 [Ktedonospora formicarum]